MLKNRWYQHRSHLNTDKHHNLELQLSWNAYGDDSFVFAVLEETDNLEVREQFWLTSNIDRCYNITKVINNCMANPATVAKRKATIIANGSTRGRQKLTKDQVAAIKYAYVIKPKVSAKGLAELYDVNKSTIENILAGRTWKDVVVEGFIPKVYKVKSQEIRDLVVDMYNKGYSINEIKKAADYTSNGSIYDILKRQKGIEPNRAK